MRYLLLLLCASCAAPHLRGAVEAGYSLDKPATTPSGVVYDGPPGGAPIIDRIVGEVAQCIDQPLGTVRMKVAPDWVLNCDQTQQMLPTYAGGGDPEKHFDATACNGAAWHWRALYQEDGLVVTTPSFFDVKDPLIRLALGGMTTTELWSNDKLALCANPSTNPLDVF